MQDVEIKMTPSATSQYDLPNIKVIPTWWIKNNKNGHIFAAENDEAYTIILGQKSNWQNTELVLYGYSDMSGLRDFMEKSKERIAESLKYNDTLKSKKLEVKEKETFLLIDQNLDDEDLKISKAKFRDIDALMLEIRKEMRTEQENEISRGAENVAKNNYVMPTGTDVFTPSASPEERAKILNQMRK
jgi:hypothetical protein